MAARRQLNIDVDPEGAEILHKLAADAKVVRSRCPCVRHPLIVCTADDAEDGRVSELVERGLIEGSDEVSGLVEVGLGVLTERP